MATVTRQIAEFWGGVCVAQIDYDDVALKLTVVRVINNGDPPVLIVVTRSDGHVVSQTFQGHSTTEFSIPKNGANSISFVDTGKGKWTGVTWSNMYPAPGF